MNAIKLKGVREMRDFLTVKEVADILGVHPISVNRYCKQNKLTYYQVGCRKRFTREDVDKYITEAKRHAKNSNEDPFNVN